MSPRKRGPVCFSLTSREPPKKNMAALSWQHWVKITQAYFPQAENKMEQDQFGQTRSKWLLLIHARYGSRSVAPGSCSLWSSAPQPQQSDLIPLSHVEEPETSACQYNDCNKGNAHTPLIPPSQKPPQLVCLNLLIHSQLINIQRRVL